MLNKNLTLSIDEELLDRARVLAAMKRTSVNAMIRDFLAREVKREAQGASRAELWGRVFAQADELQPAENPDLNSKRDELYQGVMRERGLL